MGLGLGRRRLRRFARGSRFAPGSHFAPVRLGTWLFRRRSNARNVEIDVADLAAHRLKIDGVLRDRNWLALALCLATAEV
jgi:hypothetical protein